MEELTKTEERIMQVLWQIKKGFVKDIIEHLPGEHHYNTVSSVVRILKDKGYVGYKAYGKTHEYYPLISKSEYAKKSFSQLLGSYFDNSVSRLLSFMAKEKNLSEKEIEEIQKILDQDQNDTKKN